MITAEDIKRNYKNERIRNIVRVRKDGECFQCGKVKTELMEDPFDPVKVYERMYIYCDDCYRIIQEKYQRDGKFSY
jgi:hypothetical protein